MAKSNSSFVTLNPNDLTACLRQALAGTSESALRKGALAGANIFLDEMKIRVPERTGNLAEHLIIAFVPEESVEGQLATYICTMGKLAWYGRLVENGTSKMAPKPFIRPAFEAMKQSAAEAVVAKIQEVVRNAQ